MRHALGGLASLCLLAAAPAAALEFELADGVTLSMLNTVTLGAGIRTQDYHGKNLGILNVPGQETLCQQHDCVSFTGLPGPNQELLGARDGFFSAAAGASAFWAAVRFEQANPHSAASVNSEQRQRFRACSMCHPLVWSVAPTTGRLPAGEFNFIVWAVRVK